MPAKLDKTAVVYMVGLFSEHCGRLGRNDADYCTNFQDRPGDRHRRRHRWPNGTCEVVAGDIERHMWCNQYRKIK